MNLRSLKAELTTNTANLEFAKRTIAILKKGNPVNLAMLKEAVVIKKDIEKRIAELKKDIAKMEKK